TCACRRRACLVSVSPATKAARASASDDMGAISGRALGRMPDHEVADVLYEPRDSLRVVLAVLPVRGVISQPKPGGDVLLLQLAVGPGLHRGGIQCVGFSRAALSVLHVYAASGRELSQVLFKDAGGE